MSYMLNFSRARVLVVGDVMLDQYWHGSASRISPEAPVPVVLVKGMDERPGGAANVAMNITALGAQVTLMGVVGADAAAKTLSACLEKAGVKTQFLAAADKTVHKLRILSNHHQMIRLDHEESLSILPEAQQTEFRTWFKEALAVHDVVVLSDYGKGTLDGHYQSFIKMANAAQVPILVDPKSQDLSLYCKADVLTPNLREFQSWVGACDSLEDLEQKAKQLLIEVDINTLVITRSEQGISIVKRDVPAVHIPAQAREVCDVTGAGDTVIAVMATALASGLVIEQAVNMANVAAGIVVGKLGTASVSLKELHKGLSETTEIQAGVLSEAKLLEQIQAARLRGEKIVFTNGCFDILHAGHVLYLGEARALGDRLIVAVNTDHSVKKLKGASRPINTLEDRMAVLAGLSAVDWVVEFSEDTPESLIQKINPDVMVKGGDYHDIEALPGARHVLGQGGEVQILSLKAGCSTSLVVEKILGETLV